MARISHSVDTFSEVSFPSHSWNHPIGLRTNCPWWQGWRLCTGSANWTSIHQGQPGYGHRWVPYLPAIETNIESLIRNLSVGLSGRLQWIASIMEGEHFVLIRIDTYSGYRFAFPASNASAKTITCVCAHVHAHTH